MQISWFSLKVHLLVFAHLDDACLKQQMVARWRLSTPSFLPHLLVSILLQEKLFSFIPIYFLINLPISIQTHGFLFNLLMPFILKLKLSQIQPVESLQTGSCVLWHSHYSLSTALWHQMLQASLLVILHFIAFS